MTARVRRELTSALAVADYRYVVQQTSASIQNLITSEVGRATSAFISTSRMVPSLIKSKVTTTSCGLARPNGQWGWGGGNNPSAKPDNKDVRITLASPGARVCVRTARPTRRASAAHLCVGTS